MYPEQRTKDLVIQQVENEILLYDMIKNKAFCLNKTSAMIWDLCDGKTSFDEMAKKTNIPNEFIWLAVEELNKNNLLKEKVETQLSKDRRSRRKILFNVGTIAVALPIIVAVVAPQSIDAQSGCTLVQPGIAIMAIINAPNDCTSCTPALLSPQCCSMSASITSCTIRVPVPPSFNCNGTCI